MHAHHKNSHGLGPIFYGWASFIPDPKTSLYHRQIRYMMISLTHVTSISYMTINVFAFVEGLGSRRLLGPSGRCLFRAVLWGSQGSQTGLFLPGWNGPGKYEGFRWVSHKNGTNKFFLKPGLHAFKMCLYFVPSGVEIVDQPGVDIFGQVYNQWKNKECVCPNCSRSIAASRFAPHLEKCLGMGRNSSRIANRRSAGCELTSFSSLFGEGNA